MCVGGLIADLIQNLGMLDPILGGIDDREPTGSPSRTPVPRGGCAMSPLLPKSSEPESWPERIDEQRDLGERAPAGSTSTRRSRSPPPGRRRGAPPRRRAGARPGALAEVEVPTALRREIERAMRRYPRKRSAAIPALWAVQRRYGWCTPEGISQAAAVMGVTPAYLESVASFYDLFKLEPRGKHEVLVCTNISCWLPRRRRPARGVQGCGRW